MNKFQVVKAKRQRRPLKIGLEGLSGSGKTFSALRLAFAMRRAGIGKRIVVADSENESAGLYDGISIDGEIWQYEVCPIPSELQTPAGYTECYEYLVGQGFDIIIIDSMTHAWKGALNRVDELAAKTRSGDKFSGGWRVVSPEQEQMMRTITDPRAHLITTTRVKGEYERVTGGDGKDRIKKVGTKSDQREGMEYEYDVVVRLEDTHEAIVEKVRGCTQMDNKRAIKPGPEFWKPLFDWWLSAPEQEQPKQPTPQPTQDTAPVTNNTINAISAALAALQLKWSDGATKARVCTIIGRVIADDAQLDDITEGEGVRLLAALNKRIAEKAQTPKGGVS